MAYNKTQVLTVEAKKPRVALRNVAVPVADHTKLREMAEADGRTLARQAAHLIRAAYAEYAEARGE